MEFKKLSEVEIGTATEETHVLAEIDGEIKRVPKNEVGGSASGVVFYLSPDDQIYFYKDIECTEKVTKADLIECVNSNSIVTLRFAYNDSPMFIALTLDPSGNNEFGSIWFFYNGIISLYTSEYTGAGPK